MLDFRKIFSKKPMVVLLVTVTILVPVILFMYASRGGYKYKEPTQEDLDAEYRTWKEIEDYDNRLIEKNPLIGDLPYIGDGFEIHYELTNEEAMQVSYKVVLHPKTFPGSGEPYISEVNGLTNDARSWIDSKGFNPDKLNIEWASER